MKKGISLIILVITIIVIIILAGAVILSLSQNNPITTAEEASFKQRMQTYQSELNLFLLGNFASANGNYDYSNFWANNSGSSLGTDIKITNIIKSIKAEDINLIEIQRGKLVRLDDNSNEVNWAKEANVNLKKIFDFENGISLSNGSIASYEINNRGKKNLNFGLQSLYNLYAYTQLCNNELISKGDSFKASGWFRIDSGLGLTGIGFGIPQSNLLKGYQVVLDSRNSEIAGPNAGFQIRKDFSSLYVLASAYGPVVNNKWYFIEVTWDKDGKITAKFFDDTMTLMKTLEANDTTYSRGYIGVCCYTNSSYDDFSFIY